MTSNHYTAWIAGDNLDAATLNSKAGALDAAITGSAIEYAVSAGTNTTVTTATTYYAVSAYELSFTPTFNGQVFLISMVAGEVEGNAAGTCWVNGRITDGAGATIVNAFIKGRHTTGASGEAGCISGVRTWTAGAGDVGNSRKIKVYVTHSVNGTVVTIGERSLTVATH